MARLGGLGRMRRARHLNADVNIINLVDVTLVLLIIFMVTAPIMQGGVEVTLPKADVRPVQVTDAITITVGRDGRVAFDDRMISFQQFKGTIGVLIANKHPKGVYIRGDASAPYEYVLRVLGALTAAGIENVSLVAEPEEQG